MMTYFILKVALWVILLAVALEADLRFARGN